MEVAAGSHYSTVAWTLLCHGALVVPDWMRRGEPRLPDGTHIAFEDYPTLEIGSTSDMLVCNAVQFDDGPW